jgi:hypothetical protein
MKVGKVMKTQIWNIVLTGIVTALLAVLGYLFISVSQLQSRESAQIAVEFTDQDADLLRQKLTDVMTDIDIRLRLIERDIEWIKAIPKLAENNALSDETPIAQPIPEPPVPTSEIEPRYDLRKQEAR